MEKFRNALAHKAFKDTRANRSTPINTTEEIESLLSPFFLDVNAITDSKAFRRLRDKAQVFSLPNHCHVRTRLTHTLEVAKVAEIISRFLGLNVDLCRAIALGHDIGHTPFGHQGEEFICEVTKKPFTHAHFSAVVATFIERKGKGLNLNYHTIHGIMSHSRKMEDLTINASLPLEYAVVMLSDKIAYTLSDYSDAIRYDSLPGESELFSKFGNNQRARLSRCINALVEESAEAGMISFSKSETAQYFQELRQWMNKNVYQPTDRKILKEVLAMIYDYLKDEPVFQGCDPVILLASLTDKEAEEMSSIFLKARKPKIKDIENFGIMEIYQHIRGRNIAWYKKSEESK